MSWSKLGYHELCMTVGNGNNQPLDDIPLNMVFELGKVLQLIDNHTTNISECYMSVHTRPLEANLYWSGSS